MRRVFELLRPNLKFSSRLLPPLRCSHEAARKKICGPLKKTKNREPFVQLAARELDGLEGQREGALPRGVAADEARRVDEHRPRQAARLGKGVCKRGVTCAKERGKEKGVSRVGKMVAAPFFTKRIFN